LVDGGALTVLRSIVESLAQYSVQYRIIFLISRKDLICDIKTRSIRFIYFPKAKRNWVYRLYYEYYYFNVFSKNLKVNLWLSLHDTTPRVKSQKCMVYCHNPSPFLEMPIQDVLIDPKQYLWSHLYQYLYKMNIKKNDSVICQQNWFASEINRKYHPRDIVIARPNMPKSIEPIAQKEYMKLVSKYSIPINKTLIFYPSYVRYFKNHKILFETANHLLHDLKEKNIHFIVTMDGSENKYSKKLYTLYCDLENVTFLGTVSRKVVERIYLESHMLAFPSKLETWGLPLSEYKKYNKPIIAANLKYAKEVLNDYKLCFLFNPDKLEDMKNAIYRAINKEKGDLIIEENNTYNTIDGWDNFTNWIINQVNNT